MQSQDHCPQKGLAWDQAKIIKPVVQLFSIQYIQAALTKKMMLGLGMQEDLSLQPSLSCLYQADDFLSRKDANLVKKPTNIPIICALFQSGSSTFIEMCYLKCLTEYNDKGKMWTLLKNKYIAEEISKVSTLIYMQN